MLQDDMIRTQLTNRICELSRAIIDAQLLLKNAPEGMLRISHCKGVPQYYRITEPGDTRGTYIRKRDRDLAQQLAQKDYAEDLLKLAEEELAEVQTLLATLDRLSAKERRKGIYTPEDLYRTLRPERKCLVSPILAADGDYAAEWEQEPYNISLYKPENKIYPTRKGDMVRSKSEAMLADMYYNLGVPYRYEAELVLDTGKCIYPDFTLLDIRNRKEIYHEHMGRLDEDDYRYHNFRKIDEYRKSGIYGGKNLIITLEGKGITLNIRDIERSTREMFGI